MFAFTELPCCFTAYIGNYVSKDDCNNDINKKKKNNKC